jgi:cytochrome c-type biogenesis protein CcmH/NrfG
MEGGGMRAAAHATLALLCALAGCAGVENRSGGEDFVKMQREAQAAFDSGENARAEALYKGLLRSTPNDAETWFRLGNLYARTDNVDQAVNAYLTALTLNGSDPRAWHNLGVIRLRQAWAALLRANALTAPKEPINQMSGEMIRLLEKLPYLSDGRSGKPASPPPAQSEEGARK